MGQAILAICVLALVVGGLFLIMQPAIEQARHDRMMERLNLARERSLQTQMFTQSMMVVAGVFVSGLVAFGLAYLFAGLIMAGFAMLTTVITSRQNQVQYVQAPPAAPQLPEVHIYVAPGDMRGNWELYNILLGQGRVLPAQKVSFIRNQLPPPDGKDLMVIDQ
jgi:hypothetical protein